MLFNQMANQAIDQEAFANVECVGKYSRCAKL